ncbi:hypothetical protein [Pengzhenrongella phosphoraccumulans]|jgi:hypothetical protein|uniref:hypothetical protein n=1 Tax=Pengzhenrongella phosphoraccumulans TaxID=3114394 RepID=UPI00388E53B4
MDLFTILGTCLRRWYVVLPVLAISGYFAMQAYQQVEPQYTASTSIVILPSQPVAGAPASESTPTLDNPYAGSGGPKLAAAVLSKNINSSAFRDRLGLAPDDSSTFASTVAQAQPIITVDATGASPAAVLGTLDSVTTASRVVLDEFQAVADAPAAKRYLVAAAVPASDATDITPSRWRTAGALLVIGTALAALLAVAVDAALRSRRKGEEPADGSDPESPDPVEPATATGADAEQLLGLDPEASNPSAANAATAAERRITPAGQVNSLLDDDPSDPRWQPGSGSASVPHARTSATRET